MPQPTVPKSLSLSKSSPGSPFANEASKKSTPSSSQNRKPPPRSRIEKTIEVNSSPAKTGKFNHEGTKSCPCGGTKPDAWKIDCSKCNQIWHSDCVTLGGISKESISKMLNYLCPFCYIPPVPCPRGDNAPYICHTCLNTATVRDINQWSCINSLSSNIESLGSINDSVSSIQKLDARIKHVLSNIDACHEYQDKLSTVDENLSKFNNKVDELIESLNQNNDAPTSNTTDVLLAKIDTLLSQSPPNPGNPGKPWQPSEDKPNPVSPLKKEDIDSEPVKHKTSYIESHTEGFLTTEEADDLFQLLQDESYSDEGGRGVSTYGVKYDYMGSKSSPKEFPPALLKLMDKVNHKYVNEHHKLNSCLVNRYDTVSTKLPEHSDDERAIDPNSNIFTVSLGASRTIIFRETLTGTEQSIQCQNGSLYSMSRSSQNFFKHRIDPEEEPKDRCQVRFSVTFRCIHWKFLNSTLLVGDSNFGKINMGSGKGKFGESCPGTNAFTAKINLIDPTICPSYKNIVIMVGTNDLKHPHQNESKIRDYYKQYKHKIEQIKSLSPKSNIFVCPVLPTRSVSINRQINIFNNYLYNDLTQTDLGVVVVDGFCQAFVDTNTRCLRQDLSTDELHLDRRWGVGRLVYLIKQSIFSVKRKSGKQPGVSSRSYANTVRGGPLRPV